VKHTYVLGLGAVVLLASCMTPPTSTGPLPTAPQASTHASASAAGPKAGSALEALATLPVKGRAPKTGYARAEFGDSWTDDNDEMWGHNGCDTRDDILRRDLTDIVMRAGGCKVSTGVLHDPYTGSETHFVRGPGTSSQVQIDHVVPLANAWQTGAQQWTARQRQDFANDPLELIATQGTVNEAKGDGDAATWLPPRKAFRCAYAARMVAIKLRWHLWVTAPERDALARLLQPCGALGLPTEPGTV
jgi:hypothetical protein